MQHRLLGRRPVNYAVLHSLQKVLIRKRHPLECTAGLPELHAPQPLDGLSLIPPAPAAAEEVSDMEKKVTGSLSNR